MEPTSRRRLSATQHFLFSACVLALAAGSAQAQDSDFADLSLEDMLEIELDAVTIAGIHHTHDAGEWMIGLSYMYMSMDGMHNNDHGIAASRVVDPAGFGFLVTPVNMDMHMQMLHFMYAPTDEITFMAMLPHVSKSMEHLVRNPAVPNFTPRSEGMGDLVMAGLYSAYRTESQRVIAELGVSFPTGSISEKDNNPMSGGTSVILPYPMQLGSGTWDFMPGVTYIGQISGWQWGAHAKGTIRANKNANDYRLGNRYKLTGWGARNFTDWLSGSLRLDWNQWLNIHGSDPALNPAIVPTADPDRQAGRRLDLLFGATVFEPGGYLEGNRLSVEAGLPIYQWLDGPQLATEWMISVAWDWTF